MRKHLLAIFLLLFGVALLFYYYYQNQKTTYSETVFSNEAQVFDEAFTDFLESVKNDITSIQLKFKDSTSIKDTIQIKNFFLKFMEEKPYLISTIFSQNNYKVGIIKEDKSYIIAIDSSNYLDIVRWQRFEKNKLVGSWQESFDSHLNKINWYKDLKKFDGKLQWFVNSNQVENELNTKYDNLFYVGFPYVYGNSENVVLLRFSRKDLLKRFSVFSKFNYVNLFIETVNGRKMNLKSNSSQNFQEVNEKSLQNDSINLATLNHFDKFNKRDSRIFNFRFQNEEYWNTFNRFPIETGITYYLLSITNTEIQRAGIRKNQDYLFWVGLFFILVGIAILFVKKRKFYSIKKAKLPNLSEILKENENRYLEFKSSSRWDYRQEKVNPELEKVVFKTIAAFGNTDGGILLLGVDDDKNILGLEKDFNTLKKNTADYYEVHLRNLLHTSMGVKYVSKHIRVQFEISEDNKAVCIIKVFAANRPLYLKTTNKNGQVEEKFYVRSGNSSQEITSIADITDYITTRFKNK